MLGGNGTVGNVSSVGGTVGAGDPSGPGVLTTGSLTLDSDSKVVARLDGSSPGDGTTGYDQLIASGSVILNSPQLDVTVGGGFVPTIGEVLTIINNNSPPGPVNLEGSFIGLPEGGGLVVSGDVFRLSYVGGVREDSVTLTRVSTSTSTALSVSTNSITYGASVSAMADVKDSSGAAVTTGSLDFYVGNPTERGILQESVPVNSSGSASYTYANLGAATSPPNQLYAVYVPVQGSDQYAGSLSPVQAVTVTPLTVTVSGISVNPKAYDGTTIATLDTSSATLSGVLPKDQSDVSLDATGVTATFASPDVGNNIPVSTSGSFTLTGTAASNYVLTQPTGLTGDITAATLVLAADNQLTNQGQALPSLEGQFTASGLVDGQTIDEVLATQPTLSYTVTSSDVSGTSPINIGGAVLANTNYGIIYVPGTLTINPVTETETTLSSSSPLAATNQPVTFTAQVTPTTSGAGTVPVGTVEFFVQQLRGRCIHALRRRGDLHDLDAHLRIPFGHRSL